MTLPAAVQQLWNDLEASRAQVLREVEGLSQAQTNWKPGEKDWSVGEIIDHLTIAEVTTGKLTTKSRGGGGERGGRWRGPRPPSRAFRRSPTSKGAARRRRSCGPRRASRSPSCWRP